MAAVRDDMVAVRCSGVDRGVEVGHWFAWVLQLAVYVHEPNGVERERGALGIGLDSNSETAVAVKL
jgi:hypothetical protein